ncbi:MAG: hypothetical protein V4598_13025 [Bdellovibrionota bacterium]
MNKDLFKKTGFVLLILGLGFSLEYLFYRKDETSFISPKNTGSRRILLVGGSIIDTITPGLKSALAAKNRSDVEFFHLSHPLMSSGLASKLITDHLATLKPDMVLLLVGMHEKNKPRIMAKEHRETFLRHVLNKDSVSLNKYILTFLKQILSREDQDQQLGEFHIFLHAKDIVDMLNPAVLEPELVKMIDTELKRRPRKETRILNLFMIAENLLIDRTLMRSKRQEFFLKNFDDFLANRNSSEKRELFIDTDFQWRKQISEIAGKQDLREFIIQRPNAILGFGRRLYLFAQIDHLGREMVDPRTLQIIAAMKRRQTDFGMHGDSHPGMNREFIENIRNIKETLAENNIPLILLQYPDAEWEGIKQAGEKLNIPVVSNREAFNGKVTNENYFKFFIDKTGDTGHLTEYGSEIYGKNLIEKVPELAK